MRTWRSLAAVVALLALVVACGKPAKTGSDKILDFKEQENAKRLGTRDSPAPSPAGPVGPGALGAVSPKPSPSPPPAATERFFDVELTSDSPYFSPGNELVMPAGFTLRVTNKDTTPERPRRSFTADDGSFDSGPLVPGQVWQQRLGKGGWRIKDNYAPFIIATLEVR